MSELLAELERLATPSHERRIDAGGHMRTHVRVEARILRRTRVTVNGCWQWTGGLGNDGYGDVYTDGRNHRAHRVAYQLLKGPIPEGLELDHLCRNRGCINPDHLEPVTRSENTIRGLGPQMARERQRALTHCRKGHLFDQANTSIDKHGYRTCRACSNAKSKAYQARKRAAA